MKIIGLISTVAFFIVVCNSTTLAEGKYVRKEIVIKWGHSDDEVGYEEIVKKGQEGVGGGDLISADFPDYIFVDYESNIYIVDRVNNYTIKKFDRKGRFLMKIDYGKGLRRYGVVVDGKGNIYVSTSDKSIIAFDGNGRFQKKAELGRSIGLRVDLQDNVYISSYRLLGYSEIYDFKENIIRKVNYHFVDKEGYRYVATERGVNKYDKNGKLVKVFSVEGYDPNYLNFLGVDGNGNVYFVGGHIREDDILRMNPDGKLTHKITSIPANKEFILGMDGNVYFTTMPGLWNIIGDDEGLREEGFVITKYEFID